MKEFTQKETKLRASLRKILRESFSEVDKIELLTELEDLELIDIVDNSRRVRLHYQAKYEGYPRVRELLKENDMGQEHVLYSCRILKPDKGLRYPFNELGVTATGQVGAQICFYSSKLQIVLEVYPKKVENG